MKTIYKQYGKRDVTSANDEFIDKFSLTNIQLKYDPHIDHSYMFTVYNLFDEEGEVRMSKGGKRRKPTPITRTDN